MKRSQALRILDANFNRSREGLRVCEEIARFVLNDPSLTRDLKKTRHAISRVLQGLGADSLVAARDVRSDVGKASAAIEHRRSGAKSLFLANCERAKEALRVLEETSKIFKASHAVRLKKVRFKVYAIEKRMLPKVEALRHHRSRSNRKKRS